MEGYESVVFSSASEACLFGFSCLLLPSNAQGGCVQGVLVVSVFLV